MIEIDSNPVFMIINTEQKPAVLFKVDAIANILDIRLHLSLLRIFFKIVPKKAVFHLHIKRREARQHLIERSPQLFRLHLFVQLHTDAKHI